MVVSEESEEEMDLESSLDVADSESGRSSRSSSITAPRGSIPSEPSTEAKDDVKKGGQSQLTLVAVHLTGYAPHFEMDHLSRQQSVERFCFRLGFLKMESCCHFLFHEDKTRMFHVVQTMR